MRDEVNRGDSTNLFAGDSEMAMLLRSHNWSQTPLGAIETWSDSVKMTVQVLLTEFERANQSEKAPLELESALSQERRSIAADQSAQADAFRVRLTNALRPLTDADEIQAIAARILGESLGASRVIYVEVLPGGKEVIVHKNYTNGITELSGLYSLEDFGRNLTVDHRAGRTAIVPDVANDPKYTTDETARYRSIEIAAHIDVPLIKNQQFIALLAVHQATPRQWTEDEVKRVEETAEQTWAAVKRAQAETALCNSRVELGWQLRKFDAIVAAIPDFIYTFDLAGRFTSINPALLNLLQKTLDEALGKNFFDLDYPTDLATRLQHQIQQVIETRQSLRDETPYTSAIGTRAYEYIFVPLFSTDGAVEAVAGVTRDITERQQVEQALRQSEEQSRNILESIAEAFFALDENWRFTYVNQSAAVLLNRTPDDLLGKNLWEEYPGLSDNELAQVYRSTMGDRVAASSTAFYPDHDRWYEVRAYPAPNGISVYFRNVTQEIQSEAALRNSEERLRFMLNASQIGEWDLDLTTEPHTAHRSLRHDQIFGYESPLPEWSYEIFLSHVHPDDRVAVNEKFQQTLSASTNWNFECRIVHPDQSIHWIWARSSVYCDSSGTPTRLLGMVVDISDRKQAEAALQEQTQLLQLILASIGDGLIMANPQGEFVLFNQAAQGIFGRLTHDRSSEEWSRTYGLFLPDQQTFFPDQQLPLYRAIQGESVNDVEVFVRRNPTFEGQWVSISGFPIKDSNGNITGGVITCRDVSERKRILQQEQFAREEAERANRIKDEFLAVLSHELRSPLNPILGWSKLLQRGKLDAAKTAMALTTIERNAQLQVQLIDDLLDISRILRGKLSLTVIPIDLSTVISEALETVRLAAEAKTIQIQTMISPGIGIVIGDAGRLQQVVWNLLSNAVKFTPHQGQVTVALTSDENHAQIQVTDTGKGIKSDFLPYVFEHFRQEDGATTRKFGGLGLGLAIVRQIVELHGGTVAVESLGEGAGATFTVQIPLASRFSVLPAIEPPSNATGDLRGTRILVVDDEADSRGFVAFVLEQAGAIVTSVASAIEALQAFSQVAPNVLVSDIGMPEMDGYTLIRQIRSQPLEQGGQIPAIALTAYAGELDQQQAIAAGFQHHLAKPIEPDQLTLVVATLAGRTRNH